MVRSDQRHRKEISKIQNPKLQWILWTLSLGLRALEGTGADVFRVSPSGGVFVVFVVVFFFRVVSQKESGRDPRIETRRFVSREDKMEGSKMGSDSGHT